MTDKYAFLGIYLEVPTILVETKRNVYRKPSGKIAKTRFNPETGEEYKSDVLIEKQRCFASIPDAEDVENLSDDLELTNYFFNPAYASQGAKDKEFVTIICNEFGCSLSDFTNNIELSESPGVMISNFKNKWKSLLDYYEKEYKGVNVKFGMVCYQH